jgi:hypothetical protein
VEVEMSENLAEHANHCGWGTSPGLVHDEEREAFFTLAGEFALSRERVSLPNLMGPGREQGLSGGGVIPIG